MKTIKSNKNRIKNNWMYLLTFSLSVLFTLNMNAKINKESESLFGILSSEQGRLEKIIFTDVEDSSSANLDISDIEVIEIEEDVDLGFDTSMYLPENFNPLKGKHDLDWNTIELIEIEEDVDLGFDTSKYLPENFNPLKGKHDLDWNTIELIEIEEDIEINFDTKKYLPANFNPYKGMDKKDVHIYVHL